MLDTVIKRAGIPHATPHLLRHTSSTEAAHNDVSNVLVIAKIAGHEKLSTTQGYIHTADDRAHNAMADLENVVRIWSG